MKLERESLPPELRVYTIPETAEILKVGRHKVERLIRSKKLRAKLVGNAYRVSHQSLADFIADESKASVGMTPQARDSIKTVQQSETLLN